MIGDDMNFCMILVIALFVFIVVSACIPSDHHEEKVFCVDANMKLLDYNTCVKYQDGYEMRKDFGKDQNGNLAFKEMTE